MHVHLHTELMMPKVFGDDVISLAGHSLSIECNFVIIQNLVTDPTVHWHDSTDSIVSNSSLLTLSPLLTSHGEEYICRVTISIPQLNISLTSEGVVCIKVQSGLLP